MSKTPHDHVVRHVFAHPEHARGQLQHMLPDALVEHVDWDTLEHVPGSFVDSSLSDRHADLLYKVRAGERTLAAAVAVIHYLLEGTEVGHTWTRDYFHNWLGCAGGIHDRCGSVTKRGPRGRRSPDRASTARPQVRGAASAGNRARTRASSGELERWAEQLLTATRLEEVFEV